MSGRILVVCQAWVGDVVISQSLLKFLKARQPDGEIDVLAPALHGHVIGRMPEVHRFIPAPGGHGEFSLRAHWKLGRQLRSRRYDQAIVLPRSIKSALVPFFAGATRRTGFIGEHRRVLLNDIRHGREALSTVDGFISLALEPGEAPPESVPLPALSVDRDNQAALAGRYGLRTDGTLAILAPGGEFGPSKRWPVAYFAETARSLGARGWQVAVIGSPKEAEAGAEVVASAPGTINLCGNTSLEDAVDLLALANVAISNDSGLMHIAAAVGTHVVAMYGSTSPEKVSPLTDRADVFWLALPCSPCRQRTCPLGHHECMTRIRPETVIAAALAAGSEP